MSKTIICVACVFMAMIGAISESFANDVFCPETIIESSRVDGPTGDWLVDASQGVRTLDSVGVYLGDPALRGAQVPDHTRRSKTEETVTWQLARAIGDDFWVGCAYIGTSAMLFKKIAVSDTRCVVKYTLLPTGRRLKLKSFACK